MSFLPFGPIPSTQDRKEKRRCNNNTYIEKRDGDCFLVCVLVFFLCPGVLPRMFIPFFILNLKKASEMDESSSTITAEKKTDERYEALLPLHFYALI